MPSLHDISEFIAILILLFNAFQSWRNGRAISVVTKATNGINAALVASTAKASLSEGEAKGRADEKQERADRDK